MNDAGRCWDIDAHAYGWARKIADAAHIDSRLPGHAHPWNQGQSHTMLGTCVYTCVRMGRACKWKKGIPPQKVL